MKSEPGKKVILWRDWNCCPSSSEVMGIRFQATQTSERCVELAIQEGQPELVSEDGNLSIAIQGGDVYIWAHGTDGCIACPVVVKYDGVDDGRHSFIVESKSKVRVQERRL